MLATASSSLLRTLRPAAAPLRVIAIPSSASVAASASAAAAAVASSSSLSRWSRAVRSYSTPTPPPSSLDAGEQTIYDKLKAAFPGQRLEVQDVSGGCGSFYAIEISSPAFKGLSTIKQHKLVNSCLKEDIKGIHGLQLKTIPEE